MSKSTGSLVDLGPLVADPAPAMLVTYDVNEAALAKTAAACQAMSADTTKGYEEVRLALVGLRTTRVAIEKRRVELKADALAFGRRVDGEAKRLTAKIVAIEEPLSQKKHDVDYEKAEAARLLREAKQRELDAAARAIREAEEAERAKTRAVEEQRLVEERERLDVERAQLEEARRVADEASRVERDRVAAEREDLDAERLSVAAERERVEREERERLARRAAETEAVARADRERLEVLERKQRIADAQPDIEKIRALAVAVHTITAPAMHTEDGQRVILKAFEQLSLVSRQLLQDADALGAQDMYAGVTESDIAY